MVDLLFVVQAEEVLVPDAFLGIGSLFSALLALAMGYLLLVVETEGLWEPDTSLKIRSELLTGLVWRE